MIARRSLISDATAGGQEPKVVAHHLVALALIPLIIRLTLELVRDVQDVAVL